MQTHKWIAQGKELFTFVVVVVVVDVVFVFGQLDKCNFSEMSMRAMNVKYQRFP